VGVVILMLAVPWTAYRELDASGLGRLLTPRLAEGAAATARAGYEWAADNDAYSGWDEPRFRSMLRAIDGLPGCRFVSAPDVVADHDATLALLEQWAPALRAAGQPVGFVAQDGVTPATVPWSEIDALFLGGSTPFKLGPDGAAVAREAHRRGLWLHMGRVNSLRRMRYANALSCDSIDGTNFARWRDAHLERGKQWRAAAVAQLHLDV
jgi:hypothetical protein